MRAAVVAIAFGAAVMAATGCGSSSSTSSGGDSAAVTNGGILKAGIPNNPDHLDPALSYTNEGWEILEATNNGLLTFKKLAGGEGAKIVPDIATAMPTVSKDGTTYTFHMRPNVMFSTPVSRAVEPSDIKFSIERLFQVDSGGVGFFTGIKGANAYAKSRKGASPGSWPTSHPHDHIPPHPARRHVPGLHGDPVCVRHAQGHALQGRLHAAGMADRHRPLPDHRIHTPAVDHDQAQSQLQIVDKDTPNGHLDGIDVAIGVTPDQSVNEIAQGDLDWYFESVPPDRLTELKARYPDQVFPFVRNNTTYFFMNERKYPFNKLAVRQAVNYAIDRNALVKIYGGQGSPTENILPPGFAPAYKKHNLYPLNVAKAKQLIQQAGVAGAHVVVWGHTTPPTPNAVQYLAGVLNSIGLVATVKTFDESVYWDTLATQKGDPQIGFQDWNQDYPEGQDWIDVILNGEHIVAVGNNNTSNTNVPAYNVMIDQAKAMPLGPARDAMWAKLDYLFMKNDAGWAPFMNRQWPKFVSSRLHGLVFNGTYFELFPSMYITQ